MRKWLFPAAALLVVAAFGVFGWVNRQTYTDITSQPDYLESFAVAEMPEALCVPACQELRQTLPDAPVIARATATAGMEPEFGCYRLGFRVEEVYAGEGLAAGEEIWVNRLSHGLIVGREGERYLECGFVNLPRQGLEYLLFLSQPVAAVGGRQVFPFKEAAMAAPVPLFCYEDIPNVWVDPDGISTYVAYSQVAANEFFSTTRAGLDAMERLKADMLARYPR